jgi:hypothetical protein
MKIIIEDWDDDGAIRIPDEALSRALIEYLCYVFPTLGAERLPFLTSKGARYALRQT